MERLIGLAWVRSVLAESGSPGSWLSESSGLLVLGIALVGALLVAWSLQRMAIRKREREEDVEKHAERGQAGDAGGGRADADEIRALKSDLKAVGASIIGEIDARTVRLESLVARAEQAAARLERLAASEQNAVAREEPPLAREARASAMLAPGQRPAMVSRAPFRAVRESELPVEQADVVQLAEQGHSAAEIAQKLGTPVGQIELILALRGRAARR